jgi:hypothetical protein
MGSSTATRALAGLLAALLLAAATRARAEPSPAEAALAQQLFDEARRLFDAGRYTESCEKFAASYKLDARGGTLLNLAICHEKEGKTASAWLEFSEARTRARAEGKADREKFAGARADALLPSLSRLRLDVAPGARVDGLVVRLDGAPIHDVAFGTDMPVDPGDHTVEASAPGRVAWRTKVPMGARADKEVVAVPVLAAAEGATPAPASVPANAPLAEQPPPAPAGNGRKVAGLVIGGVGIAGLAAGAVFGLEAISKRHDAEDACTSGPCGSTAQSINDEGVRDAWISDVAFGVGVVGVAVGAYLVLSAPSGGTQTSANKPLKVVVTGSGAAIVGSW